MLAGPQTSDLLASAWWYHDRSDTDRAIALAQQAQAEGQSPAADAALGFFLLRAGQLEAGQDILLRALQRYPAYAPLLSCLGQLLQQRRDLTRAAAAYRAALDLDGRRHEDAYALACVLVDLGQSQEAVRWSEIALGQSGSPARLLQLGGLRQSQGALEAAVELYRAAIDGFLISVPQWPLAHLHLVECLDRLGRESEAEAALQQALAQWPQHPDLLREVARRR